MNFYFVDLKVLLCNGFSVSVIYDLSPKFVSSLSEVFGTRNSVNLAVTVTL